MCAIASFLNSKTNSWDGGEIRAEVYIEGVNSKSYFKQLLNKKDIIEDSLGEACTWYNPEDKKSCRIYLRKSAKIKDKSDWDNQHKWLLEKLEALAGAFKPELPGLIND